MGWAERPREIQTLFNPAFVGALVREGARGYLEQRAPLGLPFPLAFLLVPLVMNRRTRSMLPRTVSTSLGAWLPSHPLARELLAIHARDLSPLVREAIAFGLQAGVLELGEEADLRPAAPLGRRRRVSSTTDVMDSLGKAFFVGRWFARAGSPATVYALWGVRP